VGLRKGGALAEYNNIIKDLFEGVVVTTHSKGIHTRREPPFAFMRKSDQGICSGSFFFWQLYNHNIHNITRAL
jgi:hypothetical protein